MACPHVSGVAALAIAYAAERRVQITPDELKELMYSTATPIDDYCVGNKSYRRYVADIGPLQPMQIDLSWYKGQMGAGQINASELLKAIDNVGTPLRFPNIYVAEGESVAVAPSRYFAGGQSNSYEVKIENTSIASCEEKDGKLIFKGQKTGTTSATIIVKGGNTEQHYFSITVRKGAAENGWL